MLTGYGKWTQQHTHVKKVGNPFANRLTESWHVAKVFMDAEYPDVEVILVNPVGLRNVVEWPYLDFHDQRKAIPFGESPVTPQVGIGR